jgi:hypothetical protein
VYLKMREAKRNRDRDRGTGAPLLHCSVPLASSLLLCISLYFSPPRIFSQVLAMSPNRALWLGLRGGPPQFSSQPTGPVERECVGTSGPRGGMEGHMLGEVTSPIRFAVTSWAICPSNETHKYFVPRNHLQINSEALGTIGDIRCLLDLC